MSISRYQINLNICYPPYLRGQKRGYYVTYQSESTCPDHTDAGLIWKFGEKSAGRGLVVYCEQPGEIAATTEPPVTIRTKETCTFDVR